MNDQPSYFSSSLALLFYLNRWHFCYLKGQNWGEIASVNFVSPERAELMKKDMFKNAEMKNFENWPESIKKDAEKKLLPTAKDYRPFFESDSCNLVIGFTTDTLTTAPNDPDKIDNIIEAVQICMERGVSGPYLSFKG